MSRKSIAFHGCAHPLATWGGEGIYFFATAQTRLLESLGRPAIVVASVECDPSRLGVANLLLTFAKASLGREERGAEIAYPGAIPPEHVLDVWQPGHPEYDRHTDISPEKLNPCDE